MLFQPYMFYIALLTKLMEICWPSEEDRRAEVGGAPTLAHNSHHVPDGRTPRIPNQVKAGLLCGSWKQSHPLSKQMNTDILCVISATCTVSPRELQKLYKAYCLKHIYDFGHWLYVDLPGRYNACQPIDEVSISYTLPTKSLNGLMPW